MLGHYHGVFWDLYLRASWVDDQRGLSVPRELGPALVRAGTLDEMRAKAAVPDPAGVLKDPAAFFRRGRSGAGSELLTEAELARYYKRAAELAPPEVLTWLHPSEAYGPGPKDKVLARQ